VHPQSSDLVIHPDKVDRPAGEGWVGIGSGWASYGDTLLDRLGDSLAAVDGELFCSAWDVALLGAAAFKAGEIVPAEQALPVYLRDKVAKKPGGR